MREYESEPIRGLPEHLPPGEEMLWQGAPRWTALARRAFHVRKVAVYFAIILVWRIFADLSAGETAAEVVVGALWILALGVVSIGGLVLLAWAMARSTVYTITTRRLVMRFGVALPMIVNFPFAQIHSAQMKRHSDDTGDIPIILVASTRTSYTVMWPHVRPWHFAKPQPMLRAIPDVGRVAEILSDALNRYLAQTETGAAHAEAGSDDRAGSDPAPTS
ncbi:photosynthetic complex putative assembly protein PuhB [Thiocapsa rosea]|uniref:PH (Pleckstrin Homology) domain-containing protein n=1 Tax=Thiocapsa rosea TaxID=69360 RepID=A0A495V4Z6_9GAMM|nr:photosynthetic complex putative assembly protein PuhB [Thiocapsa rosea]RKT43397.1 PH (Pleckstrin Homology) domain-containing protein [Thiocapsa rosea]